MIMDNDIRLHACPNMDVKLGYFHRGVPKNVLLHVLSCEDCRQDILPQTYRSTTVITMVSHEALIKQSFEAQFLEEWNEQAPRHLTLQELRKLKEFRYEPTTALKLIDDHVGECNYCYARLKQIFRGTKAFTNSLQAV